MVPTEDLRDFIIDSKIKSSITSAEYFGSELCINVKHEDILDVLAFLKKDKKSQFHMLISICAVDYPENSNRFEVVYNLLSLTLNHRIKVKIKISDDEIVPSVTSLFASANWYEREVWDMFGIMFKGNNDLRRILTDYGFEGHPLRKDFPLTGHTEVRYDIEKRRVCYEKVHLAQEFRNFDLTSPWEGTLYDELPGDEKAR
jgi:NADH-quinone oxidoreductase subunit C